MHLLPDGGHHVGDEALPVVRQLAGVSQRMPDPPRGHGDATVATVARIARGVGRGGRETSGFGERADGVRVREEHRGMMADDVHGEPKTASRPRHEDPPWRGATTLPDAAV
ncbi:MAG: hypothetical protein ACXW05_19500 [Gemmatirosa sp.]